MATYRYVAYNIKESYKKTFDDADLSLNQIIFWINVVTARLRKENEKDFEEGKFLTIFSKVSVKTDTTLHNRKYIDLPSDILDMDHHKGVRYITYNYESNSCCSGSNFAQVFFQPTDPIKAFRLNMDEYERPSAKNPYFYRVSGVDSCDNVNRVYFLGLESISVADVEIGVICNTDATLVCDLDTEINLPEYLVEELITRVLNLGRFLLLAPQENTNDGSDSTKRFNQTTPTTQPPPATDDQLASKLNVQNLRRQNIQNIINNEQ